MNMTRRALWLGLLGGLLACPVIAAPGGGDGPSETPDNKMTRVTRTAAGVEVEITSSRPFPVRALPPILKIGDREFARSRNPRDGRLDTLIFVLPPGAWEQLADGAPMSVHFALSVERLPEGGVRSVPESEGPQWDFGALRKTSAGEASR